MGGLVVALRGSLPRVLAGEPHLHDPPKIGAPKHSAELVLGLLDALPSSLAYPSPSAEEL